jgi:hypothetical protein
MRRSPITAAAVIATAMTGTHQGTPRGPISVNGKIAANATSTLMIDLGASSAGKRGLVCGATRPGEAIRAAIPRDPVSLLAR